MRLLLLRAGLMAGALALSMAGASAETIKVTIKGFKFSPAEITAKVGDTIEWTNQDTAPHTATAKDKSFDVSVAAGATGSFKVTAAGTFDYFCRIHPMMKAKLTVE